MDERLRALDWSLIRAFLAVAEEGSLSAAARRLGASQPTVGRQIKTIESALQTTLFSRHAKGLALTDFGRAILPGAQAMAKGMNDIRLAAAAQETELSGSVRITASINVAFSLLPPVIVQARRAHPGVQIDVIPSDDSENLTFGDSDIAVRMYRPEQADLIARFLGTFEIGLYAAQSYLDRVGRPESLEEIFGLDLVGYDMNKRVIDGMIARGFPAHRDIFATRCDDPLTQWELIAAGCGVGFLPQVAGDADPRVERVPLPFEVEGLPMWLTTSEAMRRTPRIRAIWDILATELMRRPAP